MKKFFVLSLLVGLFSLGVLAYTQTDVDNANFLAERNIISQQTDETKYRLDDTITRAEVAGIALKLAGVTLPNNYVCKKYFTDVTKNDWICRAVEMAADRGYVSRGNTKFRSQDKITRAEALAMILVATGTNTINQALWATEMRIGEGNDWQKIVLQKYFSALGEFTQGNGIIIKEYENAMGAAIFWKPNNATTRAEVFDFARKIFEYREMMSGETSL